MLSHEIIGDGDDVAVFAHGILGSKNNWKSFAKKTPWKCVLVDLRGHGESHGFAPPHTVEACVDDLEALNIAPTILVGHSFGGKVMTAWAARRQVRDLWVIDAPFGKRTFAGEEIGRVIEAVRSVSVPIASRKDLVETLRARGLSEPIAQWMTTNVRPDGGWKFDLDVVTPLLASFATLDAWTLLDRISAKIHVVRGGRSDRWSDEELARLTTSNVDEHVILNAGHWVHTDAPDDLLRIMTT
jgi:pimeloyl-ACP methyl ester carboxylesterase